MARGNRVSPAARETARGIVMRLGSDLREIRRKNRRAATLERVGPRSFDQMVADGTVYVPPQTASLSRR